jgi:hypothetical protein
VGWYATMEERVWCWHHYEGKLHLEFGAFVSFVFYFWRFNYREQTFRVFLDWWFRRGGESLFLVSKLRKLLIYISKNKFRAIEMIYDHLWGNYIKKFLQYISKYRLSPLKYSPAKPSIWTYPKVSGCLT